MTCEVKRPFKFNDILLRSPKPSQRKKYQIEINEYGEALSQMRRLPVEEQSSVIIKPKKVNSPSLREVLTNPRMWTRIFEARS